MRPSAVYGSTASRTTDTDALALACEVAVQRLQSDARLPEVARAIRTMKSLRSRPHDGTLYDVASVEVAAARAVLQRGVSPDHWLGVVTVGGLPLDADAVNQISDLVDAREHQVAALSSVLAALPVCAH